MTRHPLPDGYCPICGSEKISKWGSACDIGMPDIRHNLSKCLTCTHLFINPLPSRDFLTEAYKTCNPSVFTSNGFVEARSRGPLSVVDKMVLQRVSNAVGKGTFLDIGSANLKLLKMIKDIGLHLTLIEPSQHAQQFKEALGCEVFNCLFEECSFGNKFDIISAIDVLEHVNSPVDFLLRVKDILSEQGFALFRFPNSHSVRCSIRRTKWDMIRPLGHLHYFSPRSFEVACEMTNLKIKKLESHDIYDYKFSGPLGRLLNKPISAQVVIKMLDQALRGDQLFATVVSS